MESKDPKSTESANADDTLESKDPKSDATSSETLSDVKETEQVSQPSDDDQEKSEGSGVPSPDGAFDESRGGDGVEDAGPM